MSRRAVCPTSRSRAPWLPDDDRLLTRPLDVHRGADVGQRPVGRSISRGDDFIDNDREGVRKLVPNPFQGSLADQFGNAYLLGLVRHLALRKEGGPLG